VCSACDAPLPVLVAGSARATAAAGIESRCHGCKVRRSATRIGASARGGTRERSAPPLTPRCRRPRPPPHTPRGTSPHFAGARLALRCVPPPSARDLRLERRLLSRRTHRVHAGVVRQAQLLPGGLCAPSALIARCQWEGARRC
jgi:hypothetical protein